MEKTLLVVLSGKTDYNNYSEVMRNIALLIHDLAEEGHKTITFVHDNKSLVAKQADEFLNKASDSLRVHGVLLRKIVKPIDDEVLIEATYMLSFGMTPLVSKARRTGVTVKVI